MSDNLNELRDKIALALANSQRERNGSEPLTNLDQCSITAFMDADAVMTILAAHPDETGTEWGIQTDSGIEGPYSETVARMYARESDTQGWDEPGVLISRQVTEWSEAK